MRVIAYLSSDEESEECNIRSASFLSLQSKGTHA
jgi:hypothetical protein